MPFRHNHLRAMLGPSPGRPVGQLFHGEETEVGVDYAALSAADDWISGETGACSWFLVVAELGGSPDERG